MCEYDYCPATIPITQALITLMVQINFARFEKKSYSTAIFFSYRNTCKMICL